MKNRDISVTYLGLPLRSPLVPSASPLSEHLESLREMERYGAGAVVLHSLFEDPYNPIPDQEEEYLEEIVSAKGELEIPVIASLNASSPEGWRRLARLMEEAGADALELNTYNPSISIEAPSLSIEQSYIDIVHAVVESVQIPVSVKLPPFFTNIPGITSQIEDAGAKGVVFFNRIYQPDFDLLSMGPGYSLRLSTPGENRLPLRWISLLYRQVRLDLAASTGIHSGADALKMILAGASVTQICSVLLKEGIIRLQLIEQELFHWMDTCGISSLKDARGFLAKDAHEQPGEVEREEYRCALQGYARIDMPDKRDLVLTTKKVKASKPQRLTMEPQ